jgi:hypothetical protein
VFGALIGHNPTPYPLQNPPTSPKPCKLQFKKKKKKKNTYRKIPKKRSPRPFDKENNLLISAELIIKAIIVFKSFRIHSIL